MGGLSQQQSTATPCFYFSFLVNFMGTKVIAFALLCLCMKCADSVFSSSAAGRISRLPEQPQVSFQQFSGYVKVDSKREGSLFYYFVEAEVDPESKPLVLWLNGGPGCSSLGVGAFSENGPFRPSFKGLVRNNYSWNTVANILYLESPVGVGFSYSRYSSYEGVNDKTTAEDNLVFLQNWFIKFPQYKNSSLYITGESYAGHYVPQLAELMLQFNKKQRMFNLKGIALGNPVLEFATDFNSRAEFFWSHGLISDTTYTLFTSACNYSRYVSEYYRDSLSATCSKVMSLVAAETSKFIDKYDVTLDVCIPSVLSQSLSFTPQQVTENIDVCIEDETVKYLNRRDVQEALHAQLVGIKRWIVCRYWIMSCLIVSRVIQARIPVLVYSGDQDSVIPLTGTRRLVHRLARQLNLRTSTPYRVWFAGMQVGGWTQVYDNILSFATIRGASHEAPFSQPERSLVLFKSLLEGKPLPEQFH